MKDSKTLRILFAEDLPTDYELAQWELQKEGIQYESIRVDLRSDMEYMLKDFNPS